MSEKARLSQACDTDLIASGTEDCKDLGHRDMTLMLNSQVFGLMNELLSPFVANDISLWWLGFFMMLCQFRRMLSKLLTSTG